MLFKGLAYFNIFRDIAETELYVVAADNEEQAKRLMVSKVVVKDPWIYVYPLNLFGQRIYHVTSIPHEMYSHRTFDPSPGSKIWIGSHTYKSNRGRITDVFLLLGHTTNESALKALGKIKLGEEAAYTVYPIRLQHQVTKLFYMHEYKQPVQV